MDEDDEDQHYSRKKRASLILGKFVFYGARSYIEDTFNVGVQYTIENTQGMDTEEAEEVIFDKLEP